MKGISLKEKLKFEQDTSAQKDLNTRLSILSGSNLKRIILKIMIINFSMKMLKTEFFLR